MAKKDKIVQDETTTTPAETTETNNNPIVVTINVVKGGKTYAHTLSIETDDELEEKIRKIENRVKWWGGFLTKVFCNGKNSEQRIFDVVKKALDKR